MLDPGGHGRIFLLSDGYTLIDASLPHAYLFVTFFSLVTKKKTLGIIAAILGAQAYIGAIQNYHLFWKGTTALFAFAYFYAAIKVAEIGIVLLRNEEEDYNYQNAARKSPVTLTQKAIWALQTSANLRCIGLKCGKTEHEISPPSKSSILISTMIRLFTVDITTSIVHHLSLYNGDLAFIYRPWWQQASLTALMAYSLFNVFTGIYGLVQYFSIFFMGMPASQWPPMLVRPWAATSLRQFWSKEWHSLFRRIFTFYTDLIVRPISTRLKFSKKSQLALEILVVFVMSAIFHEVGLYVTIGKHSLRTLFFFSIQGPAVLLEEALGLAKNPIIGFLWTYTFLIVTGGPFGMVGFLVDTGAPDNSFLTDGFFKEGSIVARIINLCFGTSI